MREAKVESCPEAITEFLEGTELTFERVGLQAGPLAPWLFWGLTEAGVPVVSIETPRRKAFAGAPPVKTDRKDAALIAQAMRAGLVRAVHVKSRESQALRLLLCNRWALQRKRRDIENEVRGTLKGFGLKLGRVSAKRFAARVSELLVDKQQRLVPLLAPLLGVRAAAAEQQRVLDKMVVRAARDDAACRCFMAAPGIGPVTALAYRAGVDDPRRFAKSRTVGAHFGKYASGEIERMAALEAEWRAQHNQRLARTEAEWRIKTDKGVDDAKTKGEREAETRLAAAKADWQAEVEKRLAEARAGWEQEAEKQLSATEAEWRAEHERRRGSVKADRQAEEEERLAAAEAEWQAEAEKRLAEAKAGWEQEAERQLSAAEAEWRAEADKRQGSVKADRQAEEEERLSAAEAEWQAEAEQVSAAAHAQSVEQPDRHPGAVGEGAESNMADEFAELFAQQRTGQTERHTRAGEDEGPEAANDDQKGDKDEKQADEEEEGKGGKYGRPWMWAAVATIVVGLFLGPSLMPVLDGVKARFKLKETYIAQEEVLIVESDIANIREKAYSNSRIIARVAYNSRVTGIKRKGGWVRVITDGARKPVGWIHSSLLRPQNPYQ